LFSCACFDLFPAFPFKDDEDLDLEDVIDLNSIVPLRVGNTGSSLFERQSGEQSGRNGKKKVGNFLSKEDNNRNFLGLDSDSAGDVDDDEP